MNNFSSGLASYLLEHYGESDLGSTTGAENAFDQQRAVGATLDQETTSHLYGQIEKFSDAIDSHLNDGADDTHSAVMTSMKELFESITQYTIEGKLKPGWTEEFVKKHADERLNKEVVGFEPTDVS